MRGETQPFLSEDRDGQHSGNCVVHCPNAWEMIGKGEQSVARDARSHAAGFQIWADQLAGRRLLSLCLPLADEPLTRIAHSIPHSGSHSWPNGGVSVFRTSGRYPAAVIVNHGVGYSASGRRELKTALTPQTTRTFSARQGELFGPLALVDKRRAASREALKSLKRALLRASLTYRFTATGVGCSRVGICGLASVPQVDYRSYHSETCLVDVVLNW